MSEVLEDAERLGGGLGDRNGLSWPGGYGMVMGNESAEVSAGDREIIRALARRVKELASLPEQEEKKALWKKLYALQDTRPLIFCDPENAWYEIFPAKTLRCEGRLARIWEFKLRKEIYWHEHIRDDRVTEGVFKIYYVYSETPRGYDVKIIGGQGNDAYAWDPPLKNLEDVRSMRHRRVVPDFDKTNALLALAKDVLGDILEVRLEGNWWWSLGMTTDLIYLRGLERVMYDMYDNPEGLHALMSFLLAENTEKLNYLEQKGLLTLNSHGDFVGTGGYGWSSELPQSDFDGHVRPCDMWGFCESQESVGVSPELFDEFIFAYQLPLLSRFGLNIYGCCEPLDKRMDIIKRIPRLRKITVSPWSNPEVMAEQIGGAYVYTRKVNPADIAVTPIDEADIRRGLRQTMHAARQNGCHAEFLMRDVVTLAGQPQNAIRWAKIAREEAESL